MKVKMLDTVLHPFPVDGADPSKGTYSLRFEKGQVYDVDNEVGGYFRGQGWAEALGRTQARDVDVAKPFDTRDADDEEAERWEREVLQPARERQRVTTVRQRGTGTNEVLPEGFEEGAEVQDHGRDQGQFETEGETLDVHDARSDSRSAI